MLAFGFDLESDEVESVVRYEPRGRHAHVVEQVLLQSCLVDDEVRKLRQAILGVLDAPGTFDACAVMLRWAPEHGLIDPIRFTHEPLAQTERLEHFDRAAGDAVGLSNL